MKKLWRFLQNVWYFRRQLWDFRWWDYSFSLNLFARSLQNMADNLEVKGIEVDTSRLKKVQKMRRAVEIIGNIRGVNYIEMAEKELGELKPVKYLFTMTDTELYEMTKEGENEDLLHNERVYKRANEIEEAEWAELWQIFKGQDIKKYNPKKQDWDKWFDGSDTRGWWD